MLWGAIDLLIGRSWWLLVVSCLPATALLGYLVLPEVIWCTSEASAGTRWPSAPRSSPMLLAALPQVRRWIASRRRYAGRAARTFLTDRSPS